MLHISLFLFPSLTNHYKTNTPVIDVHDKFGIKLALVTVNNEHGNETTKYKWKQLNFIEI